MKKTMKKLLVLLLALNVLAGMSGSALAQSSGAQLAPMAAEEGSKRSDALAAYKKVFEQSRIIWPNEVFEKPAENYCFCPVDVDADKITEVFVTANCNHKEGYVGMMVYRKGKVDFSYADDAMFYYPKKGIVLMAYAQQGWEIDDYFQVKGGKVKHLLHTERCYMESERRGKKDRYTDAKNKKLSKSKFKKKLKGYVGKTKKKRIVPEYENTKANREKYFG